MGADYPVGIWGNAYDAFNWENAPAAHKDYQARVKAFTKEEYPSSWPVTTYVAMQMLVEAIKTANSTDSDKVAKALLPPTRVYGGIHRYLRELGATGSLS